MKKSRIIVPALAMLTLSVAASVTGTVAWFTASRTASMTLNNLVAFETSGALSMTLTAGNATVDSEAKTVTLKAMRDFSYNVTKNVGYTALFDSEGKMVTGTREVTNYTAEFGKFGSSSTPVYYANTFSATFSTSANVKSYLFFNNNHSKSHLSKDYASTDTENKSIYRALRVSMEATDSRGSDTAVTKIITWAPYTSLDTSKVLSVKEAATLAGSGVSVGTPATLENYVKTTGESNTTILENTTNVVKATTVDPITEANNKTDAGASPLLLSNELIGGSTTAVDVTVKFVIWFEGLDPACLSGNNNISTIAAAAAAETISMGFYAIEENAFAA